ncbi:MAG TPA: autotransporter-associated beta strand repeat-containing protein [Verrucomicrobiae bacterium]|nr:autotransporter-associated beta strand repeat-containing protein [Verrucomicrobiae bacterium]
MKKVNSISLLAVAALNLCFLLPEAHAAVRTWSGAGGDGNWSTAANWGGTAPVSADVLVFSGVTQQNNIDDIANLSLNGLRFPNGGFTLNGNQLALNGPVTNSAGLNILALGVNVSVQNPTWNIAAGSELRFTGPFTNSTTVNPLATLGFGGTVRFLNNNCLPNRFFTLTSGSVILDGCTVATMDGFRVQPPAGSNAVFQITNNASFTIGNGGNLRLCQTATGGSSRMDVASGVLNIATSSGAGAGDIFVGEAASTVTVLNQNGGLVEFTGNGNNRIAFANASAAADGTYNLNGGVLLTKQIVQVTAGAPGGTFNFNGGTLKPTTSSTAFFTGVQTANIQAGGAIIDTTNLNITIGQALGGTGSLTKIGNGILSLSGGNTYTGTTTVSNGTLALVTGALNGGGAVVVGDGAALSVTNLGGPISVSGLTLGGSATNTLQFSFPGGNPGSAFIVAGTLTVNSYSAIDISGAGLTAGSFPLVNFTTASGLANIHLRSLPPGVSASLSTAGSSVQLVVSSVGKTLAWSGSVDNNWDTSTLNWANLANGNSPASYAQSGGFGDLVTFDDTLASNPNVNLALAVSPVTMTLNNNGAVYTFTGPGKITGPGNVIKGGFQSVTFGTMNDYSGGTVLNAGTIYMGADQVLGTGTATLNLGTLASDGTTPRTLPNTVVQNADIGVILGDTVNTGTLTLAGVLDFGGAVTRTLNFNSDVVISGSMANGGVATKTGPGRMIITGNSSQTALAAQQQGDVIVDGGQFTNSNGWRMQNFFPGTDLHLIVTNGGVLFVANGNSTGNLRVGLTGGDNSANNILDISGTVNLIPATAAVNANNAVDLGQSGANDIVYLRTGGLLMTRAIVGQAAGNTEAHFMGGTMRAIANDTGFIIGLTNAFVEDGGLIVDTTNFSVTIPQALLASGSGGLTKIGNGTLTLTGTNTYTGPTVVSGGKLVMGPAHASPGSVTVNANSTLAFLQSAAPATVNLPSVTIGDGTNSALEAQLSVTNAPTAIITNLVLNGSVGVNVLGSFGVGQFPLFGYGTISGSGGLTLGAVPLGTVGSIVTNTANKTIDLVVSSVAQIVWKGNTIGGNWDTITTNWTVSGTPVAYAQNANVIFDDSASTFSVNLTTALTPSTMVVSNNASSYVFSGSGSLGSNMSLEKNGTNMATISSANSYTGGTTIKAGKVMLGSARALGANTSPVTVQSGATLDIAGNGPGLQPITIGGSGTDGTGALVNSSGDQNDALRAVTLSSNTVIRANALIGIRTAAETDLGLIGNGYKLVKTGAGALNLNGGEAVTNGTTVWDSDLGDIDIQQGTLSFQRRMTMGRITNTVTVEPGATLLLFTLNQFVLPLQMKPVLLNNGTLAGTGTTAPEGNTFGGPITLASGTNFIQATVGTTLELLGPIGGAGNLFENSSAAGTVLLGGTNTYTGNTVIQTGILALENNASIANSSAILVGTNTTLNLTALAVSPWTLGVGQTLGGSGTVTGGVLANGALAPGDTLGTLTVIGNLTLHGNVFIDVNKSLTQSNDLTIVGGALNNTGSGSVIVSNLGPTLAVGDTFVLFNQSVVGGDAMTITGGGANWINHLAVDGGITVDSLIATGPTNPEPITTVSSGGNLNLSWPTIGWHLQVRTNSLTAGNWVDWPNSTAVNAVNIPIDTANSSMFFRLVYP